jgi:hypothetical protein|nr:MAG TPA: hypothetical protein [Caudoviricetes sp.]
MKSEKAEKYLFENRLGYPYTGYVAEQVAERAVELAEQDAEMRMREKAIKAYCQDCGCRVENECGIESDSCIAFRTFIQKLTENEND